MGFETFRVKMTPQQRDQLNKLAQARGYPSGSAYVRSLIAQDAIIVGGSASAWATENMGIAYVIMTHDEEQFVTYTGTVGKRGHARKFDTAEEANSRRLKLPDPDFWRVGVIQLQQSRKIDDPD